MPTKHPLFREIPPWQTVLDIFRMLGLGTDFPTSFQRELLKSDEFSAAAALLEPYYIPCRAKQYLEYTDAARWCTILRQLLAPHNYQLSTKETTRQGKKTVLYTVERATSQMNQPVRIDFS